MLAHLRILCATAAAISGFGGGAAFAQTEEAAVFPDGSSFGIVPFEGGELADGFAGFIDPDDSTSVTINSLPVESWDEVAAAFQDPARLATQGIVADSTEQVTVAGVPALRISGSQRFQDRSLPKCIYVIRGESEIGLIAAQIPSLERADEDACALIQGIAVRGAPTLEDQLAGLPYQLSDLGGMRVAHILGGSSVILTDGPLDIVPAMEQPLMIATRSYAPTALAQDRKAFSQDLLRSFEDFALSGELKADAIQISGFPATVIRTDAYNQDAGMDARLVQWTVFLPEGNYVRLMGIATQEQWETASPSFDRVASGLRIAPD